uniref:Vacuolar protein sorting-associated protein 54 C-terminal domain-containing protein n=1 Tax=Phytophthora ramorum TaxID=164328 RepID=H3HAV4_PHYRM
MEASERHQLRWSSSTLLVLFCCIAASLRLSAALNCALPQPQLAGVQNATAVQLPVDIVLTTNYHHDRDQTITIDSPGRHRIPLDSVCSRTDFFVFDGYLPRDSDIKAEAESSELECLMHSELHLLIFWSAMPDDHLSRLLRVVAALSDVVSYPEANYHVRLRGVFRADPVDMVHVKGDGGFHVALVEDLCPRYAYDLNRNMVLNTNMFALKNLLRGQSPQWYQVHATQTHQESNADYKFLFGKTGTEVFESLHLDKRWSAAESQNLHVDDGAYILPWRRVFIPVDAMEMLGAMMQSEWYRFELDVPEIHAELTPGMLDPDPTSSQENIHRAAFLGSSRLPLLAHLPADSQWYKAMLELGHVKAFRVLKENTWGQQLPPCSTVGEAAVLLSSQDLAMSEQGSLRDHRHDGAKKPSGSLLSPRGLLKRGWDGVTSPLNALKDSVVAAATPRSATPTSRMTLPSPTEYPSLFDSARESSSARTGSWGSSGRTASSSRGWPEEGAEDEEERAYLSASNWGGALLDAFYPSLDVDIALAPFPGLADVSTRDFQPYLRQFGKNAAKYEENHAKPVSEQLSSSNVPSISVADEDVAKCLEIVPNLFFRPDFDFTDSNTFEEVMNMPSATSLQEEKRIKELHDLVTMVEEVKSAESTVEALVQCQDYTNALNLIESSQAILHEDAGYSEKKRQDSLGDEKDTVQQETRRLVDVLFRLDALDETSSGGSGDLGASSGSESKVSIQLRALTSDEFLQCVQMIFEHLLMVLKRTVVVQGILVKSMQKKIDEAAEEEKKLKDAASSEAHRNGSPDSKTAEGTSADGWSPSENASDEHKTLGDWKKKTRCAKVIREIDEVVRKTFRKEVQAVYTMPQLRKLYDTTMDFVVSIEKLTGKTDYTLRGALFSQLKLFLEKYHQTQVSKLVSTLDHELWKNSEISETRHKSLEDLSSGRGVALLLSDDREIAGETAPPRKMVAICGKSFRVVWSVLLMLEIVMNYMSCAANFPVLATDVLQRSIEIFRSLDLSMTLIPHIKAALAAHFTDRQKLLLDEFDRVLRDYAEHNEKIFSKFTSIVEDQIMKRFLENVATEVDYDSASLAVPTNPMRGITQSTLKLHAVLHPVLSPPQMKDVLSRVFDMFTQKLPDCFKLVQPRTAAGKKRVVEDIEMFVQSFNEVTELSFDGDALLNHFKNTYNVS